jgi:hypothetical protein
MEKKIVMKKREKKKEPKRLELEGKIKPWIEIEIEMELKFLLVDILILPSFQLLLLEVIWICFLLRIHRVMTSRETNHL